MALPDSMVRGIAFDTAGNMYVADSGNYRISKGFLLGGPVAPPILGPATVVGGVFQLSVTNSAPGSTVIIEAFTDGIGWLPVVINTAGAFDFSEPVAGQSRLYRAYLRP